MTSGTLAAVVCPILEDELVHNILNDKEEKNIFLLINDNIRPIVKKFENNGIEYTPVIEEDYLSGKYKISGTGYNMVIWMMDLGLHQEPDELKAMIRKELLRIDGKVDGIILYYGLCGQALEGICEWGGSNMRTPMTIFKDTSGRICDDCICVPLGGTDNYLKLLKKYPGIMYLTPAMACSQEEFMSKMSLFKGLDDGPQDYDMLKMILDMAGYKNAMKIQTGIGDQEHFQEACEEYSKKLGLELIELEDGWTSTEVADRTYAEAKSFLRS